MPKLKQHSVVQKSYQCQFCKVKCRRPQDLRRHLLVHTAASFECDLCGNKFTRYDTLRRHKRDNCRNAQSQNQQKKSPYPSPDIALQPPRLTIAHALPASPRTTATKVTVGGGGFAVKASNQFNEFNVTPVSPPMGVFEVSMHHHRTHSVPVPTNIINNNVPLLPVPPRQQQQQPPKMEDQQTELPYQQPVFIQPRSHLISPSPINESVHASSLPATFAGTLQTMLPSTPSPSIQHLHLGVTKKEINDFLTNNNDQSPVAERPRFQGQQVPQLHYVYSQHTSMPSIGSVLQLSFPEAYCQNPISQNRNPQLMPLEPRTEHITQRLSPCRFDEYTR